jgi:uncharacterized membrane protein
MKKRAGRKVPKDIVHPDILKMVIRHHPQVEHEKNVNVALLNRIKRSFCEEATKKSAKEKVFDIIRQQDEEILESIANNDFITDNINQEFLKYETLGFRFAEKVNSYIGSWAYVGTIIVFSLATYFYLIYTQENKVDTLILYLSIVSTIFSLLITPVILINQKKVNLRDELRSNEDYQISLKSELEIRNLHLKLDHYYKDIRTRLLDLQAPKGQANSEVSKHKRSVSREH